MIVSSFIAVLALSNLGQLAAAADIVYRQFDDPSTYSPQEKIDGVQDVGLDSKKEIQHAINRRMIPSNAENLQTQSPFNTTATPPSTVPENSTETSNHLYYTSKFVDGLQAARHFIDLKTLFRSNNNSNVILRTMTLPTNMQNTILYTTRKLKFAFPFYGHDVSQLIVTSAGFLHIGPIVHSFAHTVHYVAPLMADFVTTTEKPINIYMYDDGSKFIAQWDNLYEAGSNNNKTFTFQVSLFANGTIVFAYKTIGYSITNFTNIHFPPKVGMADGFVRVVYYKIKGTNIHIPVRRIYRYHKVTLPMGVIKEESAFVLTPIPNCIQAKSCDDCFDAKIAAHFNCKWCDKLKLCSDLFDWHRQKWEVNGCLKTAVNNCTYLAKTTITKAKVEPVSNKEGKDGMSKRGKSKGKRSAGIVIGILVAIIVIIIAAVLFYGYRNPHSKIGMFMIRNRPAKIFSRF